MKKYILGSLLGLFSLVGAFASANSVYEIIYDGEGGYSPDTLTIDGNYSFSVSDLQEYYCDEHDCGLNFVKDGNVVCSIVYNDRNTPDIVLNNGNSCVLSAGNYSLVAPDEETFAQILVSLNPVSGGDNGGGDINEDDNGNIISSGISAFSGIIDKLGNISGEFVPYLLYIGIGILGITLVIAVVKNLMGYMKGQAMGSFRGGRYDRDGMKARRTRRRRNRRFGRYLRKNYNNDTPKFGQYGYQSRRY